MLPRDTVPDSTGQQIHKAGTFIDGAVDIYAPPGSDVLAPGNGYVIDVMESPAVPGSWQIRGRMKRRDGKEVPFVCAHFIPGTHPQPRKTFNKGDVLGQIRRWDRYPKSTHIHWSFRRVGSTLPPPGNVLVVNAFKRFGRMPS